MLGDTPDNAIVYSDNTDIYTYLERIFAKPSRSDFFGVEPDSYFVLNELTVRNPKNSQDYRVVIVETSNGQRHTIYFKKYG